MGSYNQIQVGRYNRMLQKLLSMKGPASLESLSTELFPVLNTFYGAENRYLEAWDRFGFGANIAASVGNVSNSRLRNPSGSNVIAVVEIANMGVFAQIEGDLALNTTATLNLGTVLVGQRLDSRGRSSATLIPSTGNPAVLTAALINVAIGSSNGNFYQFIQNENQEIPLLPGDSLELGTPATNTAIKVAFMWRERFLEESERA